MQQQQMIQSAVEIAVKAFISKGKGKGKGGDVGRKAKGNGKGQGLQAAADAQPQNRAWNWGQVKSLWQCTLCHSELSNPDYNLQSGCRNKHCEGKLADLVVTAHGKKIGYAKTLVEAAKQAKPAKEAKVAAAAAPNGAAPAPKVKPVPAAAGAEELPSEDSGSNDNEGLADHNQLVVPPNKKLSKSLKELAKDAKARAITLPTEVPDLGLVIEPAKEPATNQSTVEKKQEVLKLQNIIGLLKDTSGSEGQIKELQTKIEGLQPSPEPSAVDTEPYDDTKNSEVVSLLKTFRQNRLLCLNAKSEKLAEQMAIIQSQLAEIQEKEAMVEAFADKYLSLAKAVLDHKPNAMDVPASATPGITATTSQKMATAMSTHLAGIEADASLLLVDLAKKDPEIAKIAATIPANVVTALLRQGAASASSLAVTSLASLEIHEKPTVTQEPAQEPPRVNAQEKPPASQEQGENANMQDQKGGGEVRPGAEGTAPNPKHQKTTAAA